MGARRHEEIIAEVQVVVVVAGRATRPLNAGHRLSHSVDHESRLHRQIFIPVVVYVETRLQLHVIVPAGGKGLREALNAHPGRRTVTDSVKDILGLLQERRCRVGDSIRSRSGRGPIVHHRQRLRGVARSTEGDAAVGREDLHGHDVLASREHEIIAHPDREEIRTVAVIRQDRAHRRFGRSVNDELHLQRDAFTACVVVKV